MLVRSCKNEFYVDAESVTTVNPCPIAILWQLQTPHHFNIPPWQLQTPHHFNISPWQLQMPSPHWQLQLPQRDLLGADTLTMLGMALGGVSRPHDEALPDQASHMQVGALSTFTSQRYPFYSLNRRHVVMSQIPKPW
jgi:hypothetical protein